MPDSSDYPMALPPPASEASIMDEAMILACQQASLESPRKRIIQPLHKRSDASLQRMLNGLQPGTYIRPHRHTKDRAESLVVLCGALLYLTFNQDGNVDQAIRLKAGSSAFGIDIEGNVWHCFLSLEPDTVLFEIKPGPYDPATDKEFAEWAPEEGSLEAEPYLQSLLQYATTSL